MKIGVSHSEHRIRALKTVSSRFFTMRHISSGGGACRFSCTISKKVLSKATERNRVKRRVRAALKEVLPVEGVYVIQIKPPAVDAPYTTLTQEGRHLFNKLLGG